MKFHFVIFIFFLLTGILQAFPVSGQQSCMDAFFAEHPNLLCTDTSYSVAEHDEFVKTVIARQEMAMHRNYPGLQMPDSPKPTPQPCFLAIDTVNGRAQILAQDGTYLADVHLALVDSTWYMWLSVDPLADKNISTTPYGYCNGNPIMLFDPDGRYVEATDNGDGTYTIQRGENNRDRNVYVINEDGQRTGESLGKMITKNSFFKDDGTVVKGAIIDTNSKEGQNFLDDLIRQSPNLLTYIKNAKEWGVYDFKNLGGKGLSEKDLLLHRYRGSMSANGRIGSARDWGNMGAGWMAGKVGLSWPIARLGFDGYQTIQTSHDQGWFHTIWQREGAPTRYAEWEGYKQGVQQWFLMMIYGK